MQGKLNIFITLLIIVTTASCGKDTPKTTCGVPTGVSTSAITSTSATLTWATVSGVTNYNVQYRIAGTSGWTYSLIAANATTNITGLTPGANYQWQVESLCSGTSGSVTASPYSATAAFTTPANAPPGSGLLKSTTLISTVGSGLVDTIINTLQYDNQNRVITQITQTSLSGIGTETDTTTYIFGAGTVVQTNTLASSITYTLNASGFRTSDNNGDTWNYNAGGYLTQSVNASATTTYTYNTLNQLATIKNVGGNVLTDTFTYAANPISMTGSSWSTGQSTGALPAIDARNNNGVSYTLTFTYVTDAQGRLSKQTYISSQSGSTPVITYFTYY